MLAVPGTKLMKAKFSEVENPYTKQKGWRGKLQFGDHMFSKIVLCNFLTSPSLVYRERMYIMVKFRARQRLRGPQSRSGHRG